MQLIGASWRARVIGVVIASCAIGAPVRAAAQSGPSDDHEPLKKATQHFLTVFENLDWDAFRAVWSENPSVFFPFEDTPERVTGKAAVEARWRTFFELQRRPDRVPPYFRVAPRNLLVQRHGDVGIVTFDLGEPPSPRRGRRTLVFITERGLWKLAHLHASVAGSQ